MAFAVAPASSGGFAGAPVCSQQEALAADPIANTSASQAAAGAKPFKWYTPSKEKKPKQGPPSRFTLMIQLAVTQRKHRKLEKENAALRTVSALQIEAQAAQTKQLQEQLQQKDAELLQEQKRLGIRQQLVDLLQERLARQEDELVQQKAMIADLRQQCDTQRVQMKVLEDLLAVRPEPQPKAPTFLDVISSTIPAAIATAWPLACSSKPHASSTEFEGIDWDSDDILQWLVDTRSVQLESVGSTECPATPSAAVGRPAPSARSSNSSSSSDGRSCGGNTEGQSMREASSWWWWGSSASSSTTNDHSQGDNKADSNTLSSRLGLETQVEIPADDDDIRQWLVDTKSAPLESVGSTADPETPSATVSTPAPSARSSNSSGDGRSCGGDTEEQSVREASSWWWWGSSASSSTTNDFSQGDNMANSDTLSSWLGLQTQADIPAGAAADLVYI